MKYTLKETSGMGSTHKYAGKQFSSKQAYKEFLSGLGYELDWSVGFVFQTRLPEKGQFELTNTKTGERVKYA